MCLFELFLSYPVASFAFNPKQVITFINPLCTFQEFMYIQGIMNIFLFFPFYTKGNLRLFCSLQTINVAWSSLHISIETSHSFWQLYSILFNQPPIKGHLLPIFGIINLWIILNIILYVYKYIHRLKFKEHVVVPSAV